MSPKIPRNVIGVKRETYEAIMELCVAYGRKFGLSAPLSRAEVLRMAVMAAMEREKASASLVQVAPKPVVSPGSSAG